MRTFPLALILTFGFVIQSAHALPRDAAAVLNRCGSPHKGDQTILENTTAGGRRILSYERATLTFDRVQNNGWTFVSGAHGKLQNLNAEQMAKYLPCLTDALAESAAPAPLKAYTPVTRVAASMKERYKTVILYALGLLLITGIILFAMSRRSDGVLEEA